MLEAALLWHPLMAWPLLAPALLDWLSKPGAPDPPAWAQDLQGLAGEQPLPWWAAGSYQGQARHHLLRLRDNPRPAGLAPWIEGLLPQLEANLASRHRPGLVVPVPSWKRRANPLPALLAAALCRRLGWRLQPQLLRRSRPVLGQHHLGRELRMANQRGAFQAVAAPRGQLGPRPVVLLVDDILTTGATACAAAEALQQQHWRVVGLACLARTPARGRAGRDLTSDSRISDGPG